MQAALRGLKPCIIGIILATGSVMIIKNSVFPMIRDIRDYRPALIACVLVIAYFAPRKVISKKISPIMLIIISAILGIVAYGV